MPQGLPLSAGPPSPSPGSLKPGRRLKACPLRAVCNTEEVVGGEEVQDGRLAAGPRAGRACAGGCSRGRGPLPFVPLLPQAIGHRGSSHWLHSQCHEAPRSLSLSLPCSRSPLVLLSLLFSLSRSLLTSSPLSRTHSRLPAFAPGFLLVFRGMLGADRPSPLLSAEC